VYAIRTILYPTDFSATAAAAFPVACALARQHQARLLVLHVYPPPVCHGEVVARRQPDCYEDDLWCLLERYQAPDPVPVEYRLAEGDAAAEIVHLAREEECDLIVLGTHGRRGLTRVVLGSVAEKVLRCAPCPVLSVKAMPPVAPAAAARATTLQGSVSGPGRTS
jgi:nucleotide-binding universal stress UspA family protein